MARFRFTDQEIGNLDSKQWHEEKDWVGEKLPIPKRLIGSDKEVLKAWNAWLFLCGALKLKLRNACPDKKIPNRNKLILFTFSSYRKKTFTLKLRYAWVRRCLGLPEKIEVTAHCPYEAYIKLIKRFL
jgi:hypothetical protein